MRSLKCTMVKLHSPVWAGRNLGDLLGDTNKHRGMDITYTAEGIFVTYEGKTLGIPHAACVNYVFADPKAVAEYLKDPTQAKVVNGRV